MATTPDPVRRYTRKAKARRRTAGKQCAQCGEKRPEALIRGRKPMICAACQRKERGQAPIDRHHFCGERNSALTVEVPVNDHRAELSDAQNDWPQDTLRNPDGSPLLAAAAALRGGRDTIVYLIEQGLAWIAEMLECLNAWLCEQLGAQWWIGSPIERWAAPSGARDAHD
jgi:hypothetical protein